MTLGPNPKITRLQHGLTCTATCSSCIQPDEAVMFVTERQLGPNTATSMGAWIAQNFGPTWCNDLAHVYGCIR